MWWVHAIAIAIGLCGACLYASILGSDRNCVDVANGGEREKERERELCGRVNFFSQTGSYGCRVEDVSTCSTCGGSSFFQVGALTDHVICLSAFMWTSS